MYVTPSGFDFVQSHIQQLSHPFGIGNGMKFKIIPKGCDGGRKSIEFANPEG